LARELVPAHLQGLERALAELHGQRAVEVVVGEHQVLEYLVARAFSLSLLGDNIPTNNHLCKVVAKKKKVGEKITQQCNISLLSGIF
jgi:hypothetical protein